jgi:uncharacterized protein YbgA (DUF1722 family)/uncharacterized protein YbbK (DUF523 family)
MHPSAQPYPLPAFPRLTLGISACLAGERVRFDGGHKRDRYITDHLARHFDFRAVCPEMAIGLGAPRPPLRLVDDGAEVRALGVRDATLDVTAPLAAFGQHVAATAQDLSGYLFKARSPSCGMERVKVYGENGHLRRGGRGIYADALMRALPLLPAEEEGRLQDPALRENFIARVYAYHRWQTLRAAGATADALVQFHTRHKLILMAHGSERLRVLGRLIARLGTEPLIDSLDRYGRGFMQTLSYRASRKRHANVLYHAMGYLKQQLTPGDKAELAEAIEAYRTEQVPRVVPITLMRHQLRHHPHPYLVQQLYWHWAPPALGLGNDT